jgi:ZIP family zinc transporter
MVMVRVIKMTYLIYVTLIGLISGTLGTLGGGLLVLLVREINDKLLSIVLGISAGIMTSVIFFDLIPEAQNAGSIWSSLAGLFLGVVLISLLDLFFPHQHFVSQENTKNKYLKAGLLLAIGIALHNVPEGLAIGAGYSSTKPLGLGLAVIMAIQNFPEGMAVATTLSLANLKKQNVIIITLLSGIPMGIGSFIGAYLGSVSSLLLSISLGFAAGAMLYITFDELVPDAHEKAEGHSAILGILTGVFLGIILTNIL